MPKPNFIFVGPSKTGSTWIYELLKHHPDVYVPSAKDLYFFDKYYDNGLEWYEMFFEKKRHDQISGELSHDYFSSACALERIKKHYPDIKLITCLRDPFDRAISSYKYFKRNGINDNGFIKTIRSNPIIIDEGLYASHLQKIYDLFPSENVLVLLFDNLKSDPYEFAKSIFKFLNIKISIDEDILNKRINSASIPRSKQLAKLAKLTAVMLRGIGLPNLVGILKRNPILLSLLFTKSKNEISDDFFFPQDVIKNYNSEIDQLVNKLHLSVEHWKK